MTEWFADRSWRALGVALSRPRRVLAIGLAVAVVGLALDTQSEVVSDVRELVPQDLQALRDVNVLQDETGVSGEIDVTVRAEDITDPKVIAWMTSFQNRVLREHGYKAGKRCTQKRNAPELCPALSLPDLFSTATQAQVGTLLDAVPSYFSQGVVTADRTTANLAFGIRLMPLDRQKQVVDDIKAALKPPDGVSASVVGLPVLAAEANSALSSPWRRGLTLLAALAGVFLVLFAARRSAREAAVPLIPIALATGWSGLVLFILGLLPGPFEVDLNPMSVTLGALVIAISTEFSVLLSSRYRQERDAGAGPAQGDRARLRVHRGRRAGLRQHRDCRLRGADLLGHPDAARLRHRDRGGPHRVPARRHDRAARRAHVGRGARPLQGPQPARRPAAPQGSGRHHVNDDRDRFEDLSPGERLAERDRTHPEPVKRPEMPHAGNKYAWLVGILMFMGLAVLLFVQTIPNSGEGLKGPKPRHAPEGLRGSVCARLDRGRRQRLPARAVSGAGRSACRPARCAGRTS